MVSWDESADVLSELADEQSSRDGALVRAAAGIHVANENHIARQWVYVCPPAWNMTPREFAAACHYGNQHGFTMGEAIGTATAFSAVAPAALGAATPVALTWALVTVPVGIGLAVSAPVRQWMARRNLERMKDAGLQQVLEVSREDFDGDHMFHTDLKAAEALKPGDLTEVRHRVLRRLWLSAGGDPTLADTLPDQGWLSRSAKKRDGHWSNRAILDIAFGRESTSACDHPDEINSPYCECAVCGDAGPESCADCDSTWHNTDDHSAYRKATAASALGHREFSYSAMSPDTGVVTGVVNAASQKAVRTALVESGLTPLAVKSPDGMDTRLPLLPAAEPAASPPAPKPTTMAGRWADAVARFEAVEKEWDEIVTDPLAALDHAPLLDMRLMPDGSTSRTGLFVEAFGKAKDLRARHAAHSPATGPEDRADVIEFEDATRAAAIAWTEAKRWAKHVGINSLPESERDIARRARKALKKAMHDLTPIEEAITAAETAARLLRSIHSVVLPEKAMLQIEAKARKAIG